MKPSKFQDVSLNLILRREFNESCSNTSCIKCQKSIIDENKNCSDKISNLNDSILIKNILADAFERIEI